MLKSLNLTGVSESTEYTKINRKTLKFPINGNYISSRRILKYIKNIENIRRKKSQEKSENTQNGVVHAIIIDNALCNSTSEKPCIKLQDNSDIKNNFGNLKERWWIIIIPLVPVLALLCMILLFIARKKGRRRMPWLQDNNLCERCKARASFTEDYSWTDLSVGKDSTYSSYVDDDDALSKYTHSYCRICQGHRSYDTELSTSNDFFNSKRRISAENPKEKETYKVKKKKKKKRKLRTFLHKNFKDKKERKNKDRWKEEKEHNTNTTSS